MTDQSIEVPQELVPAPAYLPLDMPRTLTFKTKDRAFSYHFRRIECSDWLKYFQGIVNQVLQKNGERIQVFETESSLLELVNNTVERVEGYGEVSGVKNWKAALPLKHRLAAGIGLRSIAAEPVQNEPLLCDLREVHLSATWSQGTDAEGGMTLYQGLVHRFRHPSIEQLKRFNFESARVQVFGTGENGRSIYPSRQAIAMKIYDELIESVDGYNYHGEMLTTPADIVKHMDGAHKAVAAMELFEAGDEVELGSTGEPDAGSGT